MSNTTITLHSAKDRGTSKFLWLHSRHSFSFGEYNDPTKMGFRSLRVINEDRVSPNNGFGTHPHRNMEIFSYVISGQLEHKDDMGNGRVLHAGDFQYMSAGKGVLHSEFNPSDSQESHFLQIWLQPNESGGEPRYADRGLNTLSPNQLHLIASPDGDNKSIGIRQDAEIYFGEFDEDQTIKIPDQSKYNHHWVQVVSGGLLSENKKYHSGDGIAITGNLPEITSLKTETKILLFQMK